MVVAAAVDKKAVLDEGHFVKTAFQNGVPFSMQKSVPAQKAVCVKQKLKDSGTTNRTQVAFFVIAEYSIY